MRFLVTGASGFLGLAVRRCLQARDVEVVIVSRRDASSPGPERSVRIADTCDYLHVRRAMQAVRPDRVLHLAGTTDSSDLTELYRANVVFGAHILRAAQEMDVRPRVLLAGSAAEYGLVPDTSQPVVEDEQCRPNTAYGISKMAQSAHARVAAESGLHVTVARLFNPIGPGMPSSLALGSFAAQIAAMTLSGGVLTTGDLQTARDFMNVNDAARAIVGLLEAHPGDGSAINICSGHEYSLAELTRRMITLSGLPIRLSRDPTRKGNSQLRRFVGDPSRLDKLGLHIPPIDVDMLLLQILEHARNAVPPTL